MEDKLVQMPLVLTCALLLMALTARSVWSGKSWEGRRAGMPLKEELPLASFGQLTSHFVVPRGFSPRW